MKMFLFLCLRFSSYQYIYLDHHSFFTSNNNNSKNKNNSNRMEVTAAAGLYFTFYQLLAYSKRF